MVVTTKKGTRKEKICSDELKQLGYITWKTIRHKFLNIDLFGLFDVVGLHPEGKDMRFIQVKSNKCDGETREKIGNLKMPPCCKKEIWIWKDREGWSKEFMNKKKKKKRKFTHTTKYLDKWENQMYRLLAPMEYNPYKRLKEEDDTTQTLY